MPTNQIGFYCALCLSAVPLTEYKLLHCYHGFCDGCVSEWLESNRIGPQRTLKQLYCPTCRKPASESDLGRMFVEPVMLDEDTGEPQNPLTRKFTEGEWEGLKELRTKLPYIFETAFPRKENKLSPVTLWGIPINPLNPATDARVSVILVKFLRAMNLDVEKATKMMISTFKWRDEFKIDQLVIEEFPQGVFGRAGRVFGKDKDGRPVIYNIYRGQEDTTTIFADVPRYVRWRVRLMEHGIRLIDFVNVDSMVQIDDFEGGIPGMDANSKPAIVQTWAIFRDYYPDRFLFKHFCINAGTFVAWACWLLKPLFNFMAKANVVGSGTATIRKGLLPTIDTSELPKRYGGEADAF